MLCDGEGCVSPQILVAEENTWNATIPSLLCPCFQFRAAGRSCFPFPCFFLEHKSDPRQRQWLTFSYILIFFGFTGWGAILSSTGGSLQGVNNRGTSGYKWKRNLCNYIFYKISTELFLISCLTESRWPSGNQNHHSSGFILFSAGKKGKTNNEI